MSPNIFQGNMAFSGFGKNSSPSAPPEAQNPFANFPRPPPSSPLPISPGSSIGYRDFDASEGIFSSPLDSSQPFPGTHKPSPNQPALPRPPPELHQSDADEDDENVKQLRECSSFYLSLQDCLVNSNRNWKSCQKEVQILKECNERRKR